MNFKNNAKPQVDSRKQEYRGAAVASPMVMFNHTDEWGIAIL